MQLSGAFAPKLMLLFVHELGVYRVLKDSQGVKEIEELLNKVKSSLKTINAVTITNQSKIFKCI